MNENPSIISHVSVGTNDYKKAIMFYGAVFDAVGIKTIMDLPEHSARAYGRQFPEFWVNAPLNGEEASVGNGTHVAFLMRTQADVDTFHAVALQAGGVDNGAPGPREHYGAGYYGAFIMDLDGNKIEAMHWDDSL